MRTHRVAVCSRSFSRNEILKRELLDRYPHVTFNTEGLSLSGEALRDFLRGHDKAIVALERIDASLLDAVPELRVVAKYGVGLDGIDVDALRERSVALGWTPGVNRRSVAELALGFAIDLLHGVGCGGRRVRSGTWQQIVGRQLTGRVVGILGLGQIGAELVELLAPFRCTVLAHDLVEHAHLVERGVTYVGMDELLERAELLSIHLPLDASTRGILDRARLGRMRKGAYLINTARGGLVDEVALRDLLEQGHLAGAAFDVLSIEPPVDRVLLELESFQVTPHIGGSTVEAILAMGRAAIAGLDPTG